MRKKQYIDTWIAPYDNDNTSMIPEVWAQESLMYLENNLVAALLVHRDFENEVARFGDVVNSRRPAGFTAVRKVDGDDVTVQDARAANVAVRLDQHWHTSFLIYDGEESKSMKDLVEFHVGPALSSIAQAIDQVVIGEIYSFLANSAGKLGTVASISDGKPVIALREVLTKNSCPMVGRRFLMTPDVEGAFLGVGDLVNAHTVGDEGSALREGHLGRKYGFDMFTSQNVPSIPTGNTVVTGTINNGNVAAGSTVLTVTGFTGAPDRVVGSWCTIGTDMIPQRITASANDTSGDLVQITVSPGLKYATVHGQTVTIYTPGRINEVSNYAAGYSKSLVTKDFTVAPKPGQLVAFGTAADVYGAVGVPTTTSLVTNRSLDTGVLHEANVNIGPAGEYCFGFHRNAISLVTRPLALPREGTGVRSAVANYNGLSIRATIGYNMTKQATQVTLDILTGVKTLDEKLGAVMFA